jgi:hypothetical protein
MTRSGVVLAAVLAGSMLAGTAWAASDAQSHWAAMTDCAALGDAPARHACTDAVLRGAGLLDTTPARAEAAAPIAPAAPETVAQTPKASEDTDHAEVTLAKAVRRGDGRLVLTAADGVIWRQLYRQGSMPIPKAGATMAVRQGAMDGYVCVIDLAPSFRCRPDR